MNFDTLDSQLLVIIGFALTIAFNAGINWAIIRQLRRDLNGYKKWADAHEEWAHKMVEEYAGRVARLEGKIQP